MTRGCKLSTVFLTFVPSRFLHCEVIKSCLITTVSFTQASTIGFGVAGGAGPLAGVIFLASNSQMSESHPSPLSPYATLSNSCSEVFLQNSILLSGTPALAAFAVDRELLPSTSAMCMCDSHLDSWHPCI